MRQKKNTNTQTNEKQAKTRKQNETKTQKKKLKKQNKTKKQKNKKKMEQKYGTRIPENYDLLWERLLSY